MTATRAEDGNEGYVFSADLVDQGRFYVSEQWASQEVMDTHMASPHLATFMGAMGDFGVTGASLTKWDGATPSKLM
jgi:quinol monooxygenase YgiN